MGDSSVVGFDGVCPVCGSKDGMIILFGDGKFRTICRVIECPVWYKPSPLIGFDSKEDCQNPFDSEYLKDGTVSVGEYVYGVRDVENGK